MVAILAILEILQGVIVYTDSWRLETAKVTIRQRLAQMVVFVMFL